MKIAKVEDAKRSKGTKIVKCPYCPGKDAYEAISGDMYVHVKKVHGRDKWIEYRRTKIPGVREFQCDKCKIYLTANRNHECIIDKVEKIDDTTSGISTENRVSTEISTAESPVMSSDSGQYEPLGTMALLGTRSWRKDRKRARKEAKIGRKEDAKKSRKNKIVVQEEKIIEDFIKCFICFAQGGFQNEFLCSASDW